MDGFIKFGGQECMSEIELPENEFSENYVDIFKFAGYLQKLTAYLFSLYKLGTE